MSTRNAEGDTSASFHGNEINVVLSSVNISFVREPSGTLRANHPDQVFINDIHQEIF